MPYEIRKAGSGWKVYKKGTNQAMSKEPLSEDKAKAQMAALYASEAEAEKESGVNPVMIGLKIPDQYGADLVRGLKHEGIQTRPLDKLHLTLCELGPAEDLPFKLDSLVKTIHDSLWEFARVAGKVTGFGRFDRTYKAGYSAIWASFDSAVLADLRQALVSALKDKGYAPYKNHGFTPHITLAYIPEDMETPHLKLPSMEIPMQDVTLYVGDVEIPIRLKGDRIKAQPADDASAGISVFKEKSSGKYRWVMLSSNAYQDRDRQIVSEKALRADVARADSDGNYGPLRWWHVPGLDIGTTDFNMMHGRVLIESGIIEDAGVAEAVKENAGQLSGSIAFRHPLTEPDDDGVFHTIRRTERSLLPKGKESNPFVTLIGISGDDEMTSMKEKLAKFMGLINDTDGEKTRRILDQAEGTEKMAQDLGAAFKEAGLTVDDDVLESLTSLIAGSAEKAEHPMEEEDSEDDDDEAKEEESEEEEEEMAEKKEAAGVEYIGDMNPVAFGSFLGKALQSTVGERLDQLEAQIAVSQKEVGSVESDLRSEIETLKQENQALRAKLNKADSTLKEMGSEIPPALAGFIMGYGASQDGDTVVSAEEVKERTPHADSERHPVDGFMGEFLFKDGMPTGQ